MKKLMIGLSLMASIATQAANTDVCNMISHESMKAKIEVKNSAEMVKKYNALAEEASDTSTYSTGIMATSAVIIAGIPFAAIYESGALAASTGLLDFIAGVVAGGFATAFSFPTALTVGGWAYLSTLIYDDQVMAKEAEVATSASLTYTLASFESAQKLLDKERKEIDLDYSWFKNMITLGSKAENVTEALAANIVSKHMLYVKKAQYLEIASNAQSCSN